VSPLGLALLAIAGYTIGSWAAADAAPSPTPKPGPTGPTPPPAKTYPSGGGDPERPPIDPALAEIDPIFASYVFAFASVDRFAVRLVTYWAITHDDVPSTAGLDAWAAELEAMPDDATAAYAQIIAQAFQVAPQNPEAAANLLGVAADTFRGKQLAQGGANLDALAAVIGLGPNPLPADVDTVRVLVRHLGEQGLVTPEFLADLGYEVARELFQHSGSRWEIVKLRRWHYQPGVQAPPPLVEDLPEATYAAPPYYFAREWHRTFGGRWQVAKERWNW
jgi:hypothetical protein